MNSNILFIIAGIIAIAVEVVIGVATGFELLVLGVIMVIGGAIGFAVNSFQAALLTSAILTVGYIAIGRGFLKKSLSISTKATNADALIGQKGVVIKPISPSKAGQVKLGDEVWRATAESEIAEGSTVTVVSISGVTITVK
jgi:membrane protein implicated in regulation of membrane protease activity